MEEVDEQKNRKNRAVQADAFFNAFFVICAS